MLTPLDLLLFSLLQADATMMKTEATIVEMYVAPNGDAVRVIRVTNAPLGVHVCFDGNDIEIVDGEVHPLGVAYAGSVVNRSAYGNDVVLIVKNPNVKLDNFTSCYPRNLPEIAVRDASGQKIVATPPDGQQNYALQWPTL